MKKGFTLVELLAVIVIVAIILAIAVPRITEVIENARIQTYISNEEMVLRAIKLYTANETNYLPIEVGDTNEVPISQLVSEGYISKIKNPYNNREKCNGYITITKISNNKYDYTPHLKCGLDMHSSSDDELVLHYKFDDFQEPTENLYTNLNLSIHSQGGLSYQYIGIEDGWIKYSISGVGTGHTYPYTFNIRPRSIHSDYYTSFSWLYKTNVEDKYLSFGDPRMVNIHYKPGFRREEIILDDYRHSKIEKVSPLQTTSGIPIEGSSSQPIYFLSRPIEGAVFNPDTDFLYFKNVQVEIKEYATQYTNPGIREGIIKDYSGNGNNSVLDLVNSPRYVENARKKSGAYEFNGKNQVIETTLEDVFDECFTIMAWVKRTNGIPVVHQRLIGFRVFGKGIDVDANGNIFAEVQIAGNRIGTNRINVNSVLPINDWVLLTMVLNNSNKTLTLYTNDQMLVTRSIPDGEINLGDKLIIGNELTRDHMEMEKKIDDVRIYNRALSEHEIKMIYETTK